MRRLPFVLLVLAPWVAAGPSGAGPDERPAEITRGELRDLVRTLASDDLRGREAGTPECDLAAEIVAREFERLGLEPLGDEGTFHQRFESPRGMRVLATSALEVEAAGGKTAFALGVDFAPLDLSGRGDVVGTAVFAGYGIRAPDLGYDDYVGLDVTGRVVVVLRHAPAFAKSRSPFGRPAAQQRYAAFQAKVEAAAAAGAAALVVVNDPETFARSADDVLRPPGGSATGRIPVVHVTWRAGRTLSSRLGVSLAHAQQAIDARIQPRSEARPDVRIRVRCDLEPEQRQMRNVVARLSAARAVTGEGQAGEVVSREAVLLGAHYDHVGLGRFGSLANADGEIHNGADDNASGTSALIEVAGYLAARREALRRDVVFVAFSGEELGLLGSRHYVGRPAVPLADTVAMLNFDMVGRAKKNRLYVGGTGTSPLWPEMVARLNGQTRFDLTLWPGGKAPSDHTSFYERELPVLLFFTGLHADYHRPSDDWRALDYAAHARVAELGARVAFELAVREDRPPFTRCDAGGFEVGPYLGIAVEQRPDGVYVAHVEEGSPAKRFGFEVGDKLLEWNDQPVPHTNAYNDLISRAEPGEKVEVLLERGGRTRRLKVKLGST